MRKKEILKMAFYLVILSGIAKILSLVIKIVIARTLSTQALTYYSLCAPTMVFFIALAQLGLPATISKIVADQSLKNEEPILASIIISLINNLILVGLLIVFIPLLSTIVFKNANLKSILYAIVILLPLVTFSGILKGYFVGKQKHIKNSLAAIIEEISRGLFILIAFACVPSISDIGMAFIAMLSISVGELGTICFLGVDLIIHHKYFQNMHIVKNETYKNVLSFCIPITAARLIGSFTFFIEPFVIGFCSKANTLIEFQNFYGSIHGYALPILTLPSFISMTLANYILPTFTYEYSLKHYQKAKLILNTTIFLNLTISLICSCFIFLYPSLIVDILYKKSNLLNINIILKNYTFLFALCSIQALLSAALQGANQSKKAMIDTSVGCLFRIILLAFGLPYFKEQTIILALFIGMLTTTIMHVFRVFGLFFQNNE